MALGEEIHLFLVLTSTNGLPLKPEPHRLFTFSEFLPSAAK